MGTSLISPEFVFISLFLRGYLESRISLIYASTGHQLLEVVSGSSWQQMEEQPPSLQTTADDNPQMFRVINESQ
jgi:hypothetical protein